MRRAWVVLGLLVGCAGTTPPMAPERSPHFDAVADRLQLGGTMYMYVDLDGDPERVASFLLSLLRDLPDSRGTPGLENLNAAGLVDALGVGDVAAVGLSSYKKGALYHNRSFIYQTGPRSGVLALFGENPTQPTLSAIAPRSADLVWEQRVNIPVLVDVAKAITRRGVLGSSANVDRMLARTVPGIGLSLGALIERLDTTLGLIIDVDEERVLRIPGEALWFPYVDFLFQIDGLGDVADAIAKRAAFDPFLRTEETEEWVIVRPGIRLPPPWGAYAPSLIKERTTGRVYVVSRPEYLTACLLTEQDVTTTDAFGEAFDGLPALANGTLYLSPQFTRELHSLLDRAINANGSSATTTIVRALLPDAGAPTGWVATNRDDGILFASNSSSSHKSTLTTLGFAALWPAIAVLGPSVEPSSEAPPEPFNF